MSKIAKTMMEEVNKALSSEQEIGKPFVNTMPMIKEEPKQESLEEVAHKILVDYGIKSMGQSLGVLEVKKLMVDIAKWQQKRSYSEEEIIEASKYGYNFHKTTQFPQQEFEDSCIRNTHQWLEQFKKK